jgi:predicted metal-binding transcription factor (methanogenesis marker protein 9)
LEDDVEAAGVAEDVHQAQEEARDALAEAGDDEHAALTLLRVDQVVEVVV